MPELTPEQIMDSLSRRWKPTKRLMQQLKTDSATLRRTLKKLDKEGLVEARKRGGQFEWRLVQAEAKRISRIKKEPKTFIEEQKTTEKISSEMQTLGSQMYTTLTKGEFPEIVLPSRSTSNIRFDDRLGQFVLADKTVTRSTRNVGQIRSFSQLVWVMRFLKELLAEKKSSTLRDIYYQSFGFGVKFAQQSESDTIITDVEATIKAPRESFRVFPEERAAIYGDLTIEYTAPQKYAGKRINLTDHPDGLMIGPYLTSAKFLKCKAHKVIAIECLSPNTLIQLADGNIVRIDSMEPETVVTTDFDKMKLGSAEAVVVAKRIRTEEEQLLRLRTGGMSIDATERHRFFTLTDEGIVAKRAADIEIGDWIAESHHIQVNTSLQKLPPLDNPLCCKIHSRGRDLLAKARKIQGISQLELATRAGLSQMTVSRIERGIQDPEKDKLDTLLIILNFDPKEYSQNYVTLYSLSKRVHIPSTLTPDFGEFLGYLLGDGYVEYSKNHYWTSFTEKNQDLLKYYLKLGKDILGLEGTITTSGRQRLTYYSAPLARYLLTNFSELLRKSPERDISPAILRSPKTVTAAFLRGLFDAEANISRHSIYLRMSSPMVIRKVQLLLLRHRINSHLTKSRTNKTTNLIYRLQITDWDSLNHFSKFIGFNHSQKREALDSLIHQLRMKNRHPNRPRFPPPVRKIIRHKLQAHGLPIPPKFYGDDRGVSEQLLEEANSLLGKDLDLQMFLEGDLMWSKVREKQVLEDQPTEVWDISVPGFANFIANGIITHNSGGMFTRFVEDGVYETQNAILIHTAGQAPRSVRRIIRRLRYELNLPTFLFVDADPWGAHIAMVIISGSASAAHLRGLATPDAIWMGVWASDIEKYNLPSDPFTDTDKKRTQELLNDPRYQSKFWQKELNLFLKNGRKAEQQAFSRYGLSFVTEEYLPKKFTEIAQLQKQGIL